MGRMKESEMTSNSSYSFAIKLTFGIEFGPCSGGGDLNEIIIS